MGDRRPVKHLYSLSPTNNFWKQVVERTEGQRANPDSIRKRSFIDMQQFKISNDTTSSKTFHQKVWFLQWDFYRRDIGLYTFVNMPFYFTSHMPQRRFFCSEPFSSICPWNMLSKMLCTRGVTVANDSVFFCFFTFSPPRTWRLAAALLAMSHRPVTDCASLFFDSQCIMELRLHEQTY